MHFAENLRTLRMSKKMTTTEIGEIVHKSNKAVQAYEREIAQPSLETLIKLSDFFNVTLDKLIKEKILFK